MTLGTEGHNKFVQISQLLERLLFLGLVIYCHILISQDLDNQACLHINIKNKNTSNY